MVVLRQVEFPPIAMAGIHGGGDRTGRKAIADRIDRHDSRCGQRVGLDRKSFVQFIVR
jgi:hypothetical protein